MILQIQLFIEFTSSNTLSYNLTVVASGLLTSRSREIAVCLMKDGLHHPEIELFKSTSQSSFSLSLSLSWKKLMLRRIPLAREATGSLFRDFCVKYILFISGLLFRHYSTCLPC